MTSLGNVSVVVMSRAVDCAGCGRQQELPTGYARPQFRCAGCGALNDLRESAAPPPAPVAPTAREILLHGTDDENDFNPYQVRGDVPTGKCAACGQAIHSRVTVCNHCGIDLVALSKERRTFVPFDRTWEVGWSLSKRLTILAVLQVINLIALSASLASGQSAVFSIVGVAAVAALQAFLLGTYDRIHLTRNVKGKTVLTRTWRYAFLPRPTQTIRWREHEGICVVMTDETEPFDWVIVGWLTMCAIVPGIVFWWLALRGERYHVALCRDHGFPAEIIFRTRDRGRADEIMKSISEVAMLPIAR